MHQKGKNTRKHLCLKKFCFMVKARMCCHHDFGVLNLFLKKAMRSNNGEMAMICLDFFPRKLVFQKFQRCKKIYSEMMGDSIFEISNICKTDWMRPRSSAASTAAGVRGGYVRTRGMLGKIRHITLIIKIWKIYKFWKKDRFQMEQTEGQKINLDWPRTSYASHYIAWDSSNEINPGNTWPAFWWLFRWFFWHRNCMLHWANLWSVRPATRQWRRRGLPQPLCTAPWFESGSYRKKWEGGWGDCIKAFVSQQVWGFKNRCKKRN